MLTREIPSSGEKIPAIGIGTWQQFDVPPGDQSVQELTQVLKLMQASGATLIDSSPMYGRSETTVGELTSKLADNFFYATKVWTTGKENGIAQMNDSMRKMKRVVMDLMQVHNLVDVNTHLKTLREWKASGKIRYIGVTHYLVSAHKEVQKIIEKEPLDFVQFNYSILTRDAETSLLKTAYEKGVAVIINEPLEKGILFKRVKGKPLPGWAAELDIENWSSFFLKYIISHPAVTCVIPGTSNPAHMEDILSAGEGVIPDEAQRKKMVDYFDGL